MSLEELDELYREVILDHYRNPRNNVKLADPDLSAVGYNPFCGDEVTITAKLDKDARIQAVGFRGQGCSISQSSASMMTELLKGHTIEEAEALVAVFKQMMLGKEMEEAQRLELGELEALEGVRQYPIRIKCALLAWSALLDSIKEYRAAHRAS
ncbi:MAG: SUF system NifU family Fe-S cluster assembly protein [Chloroflexi bacterium]|nr:SUF system NifU family Fe-S cluster assembly protein [Chloroflexota bacterium]